MYFIVYCISPQPFGARDWFCGRQFFHGRGWKRNTIQESDRERWGEVDETACLPATHLLLCSLIPNQGVGTPGVLVKKFRKALSGWYCKISPKVKPVSAPIYKGYAQDLNTVKKIPSKLTVSQLKKLYNNIKYSMHKVKFAISQSVSSVSSV